MAVPKRRISKARRGERRAHQRLVAPAVTFCPQCNTPVPPHHVCPKCGHYQGRTVVEAEE